MERFYKVIQNSVSKYIFAFSLIFLISSCDNSTNSLDINLFAPSDDLELGRQLDSEIVNNPTEYPILRSPQHSQYLQDMVNQIIESPEIEYKGVFSYQVKIINTNTINAFAAPGGYLYVYKGLLQFVDNEATLAGILAHEIAHAERRHATKRMTKQYGLSLLSSVILGDDATALEQIASNLLSGLALLKNSRDDEYEADEYSFKYLKSTIWYPGGIKYFFEKIQSQQTANPSTFEELLSTHPLDDKRKQQILDLLTENNIPQPTENNIFTTRYNYFKSTLPK